MRIKTIGITIDNSDNVFISGIVYDPTITFGSNPVITNNGVYDVVVAKYGSTAGIAPLNENAKVIIYPNPSSDIIYISSEEEISAIEMYNSMGEKIREQMIYDKNTGFDISTYSSGIYFLHIHTGKYSAIRKITLRN